MRSEYSHWKVNLGKKIIEGFGSPKRHSVVLQVYRKNGN